MSKGVYVDNISFETTEEEIRNLFSVLGEVKSIYMVINQSSGLFEGCCFVKMATLTAREVVRDLDESYLGGRLIRVQEARPKKKKQVPEIEAVKESATEKPSRRPRRRSRK